MNEKDLKALYDSFGLAMTFKDFLHIQKYFHDEEKRDPSMTEIRVLDTYWLSLIHILTGTCGIWSVDETITPKGFRNIVP